MKQLIVAEKKTVTVETIVQALELHKKFGFVTCTFFRDSCRYEAI